MWRPIEEGKGTVKPKKDIRIQQQFEATIDIVFPFEGERTLNKHELDLSSTFWAMWKKQKEEEEYGNMEKHGIIM